MAIREKMRELKKLKILKWIEFFLGAYLIAVGLNMAVLDNSVIGPLGTASLIISGLFLVLKSGWTIFKEWDYSPFSKID